MNMKFKRAAAACAAVMMAGTFFTACGDNASTGDTTTTAANSAETTAAANGASDDTQADTQAAEGNSEISGTIKVLHHRTDRDQDGTMAKLTEGFNALYPNVTVEYQSFTNYADDIATMMQSDNYGDVLMTPQALKQADLPNFFASFGSYDDLSQKYYWLETTALTEAYMRFLQAVQHPAFFTTRRSGQTQESPNFPRQQRNSFSASARSLKTPTLFLTIQTTMQAGALPSGSHW